MTPASSSLLILLQFLFLLTCTSAALDSRKQGETLSWNALPDIDVDQSFSSKRRQTRGLQVTGGTDDTPAGDDKAATDDTTKDDDDGTSLFPMTDDAYNTSKTSLLPEEQQPSTWPATVLIIFLVLAAVLLGMTAFKNCRKRREYQDIPTTSLIV